MTLTLHDLDLTELVEEAEQLDFRMALKKPV